MTPTRRELLRGAAAAAIAAAAGRLPPSTDPAVEAAAEVARIRKRELGPSEFAAIRGTSIDFMRFQRYQLEYMAAALGIPAELLDLEAPRPGPGATQHNRTYLASRA